MSAGREELIPEEEAARLLGVAAWRLRELAAQGELRLARAEVPGGERVMYFLGEVLRLRERIRGAAQGDDADEAEDWPDIIDG